MTSSTDTVLHAASQPMEDSSSGTMGRAWHDQPAVLHQLVRAQARQTPDRIAAVYEDQWISYRELVTRSGTWAYRLRRLGVDVGTLVGIYLERSLDLPMIVLAILESGGVCVPLEPSDPSQRVAAMIRETGPSVILTQRRLRPHLPATTVPVITVDEETPDGAMDPEAGVTGDNLAFVLMTSGSTGVPKGVMVSHATVAARMFRSESDLPDAGSCMAIMKTPISNSPILGEMFAPLLHGCYFVIARPDAHQDIPYLGSLILNHRVTHIAMTSAVLRAFLQWPDAARCRSLKAVYCGGEAVSDDLRRRFVECFSQARFIITYGTTEAGHKLSCECPAIEWLDGTRIGRAIPKSYVQLLDLAVEPIPVGEVGEMYLGGPRLATGYLNRPAWTAERFVPHPFSTNAGDRLYRSGDLGRLRPDGELEFKGRVDQLVKIRGNRVELLEVETALAQCPGILEAVVLARTNDRGDVHLVACIVPKQKPGPAVHELRARLAERLPYFMVPQVFVTLDEIPRTPNGKLNRKALSALELPDREPRVAGYAAAQTPTERILAEIWQRALGIERVGLHDNFFALGGDSILAARVCSEIESKLRRRIPLSVFFGAPNLAILADAIVKEQSSHCSAVIVPLQTRGKCSPLFLMPAMSGSPWISRNLLECLDAERPVFALGLAGDNASWGERVTMQEIASHCVAALREAKVNRPFHIMGASFGGVLAYEVARQLHDAGIEVGRVAIIDAWIEQWPGKSRWMVLRAVPFFFANLPRWVFHFVFKKSPARQISAIRGRFRSWMRRIKEGMSGHPTVKRLDWLMDKLNKPEQLRKRIETNFNALQSYVPGLYSGRVVLFRAKTRPLFHGLTPDLDWGQIVTGGVEVIAIPGNHNSIFEIPNNEILAELLQAVLDRELSG